MSIEDVRIKKIEIYGDLFYGIYLGEPKYDVVKTLQKCLMKKKSAKVTFEKDGKIYEEELYKIEECYLMTKSKKVYCYRKNR